MLDFASISVSVHSQFQCDTLDCFMKHEQEEVEEAFNNLSKDEMFAPRLTLYVYQKNEGRHAKLLIEGIEVFYNDENKKAFFERRGIMEVIQKIADVKNLEILAVALTNESWARLANVNSVGNMLHELESILDPQEPNGIMEDPKTKSCLITRYTENGDLGGRVILYNRLIIENDDSRVLSDIKKAVMENRRANFDSEIAEII